MRPLALVLAAAALPPALACSSKDTPSKTGSGVTDSGTDGKASGGAKGSGGTSGSGAGTSAGGTSSGGAGSGGAPTSCTAGGAALTCALDAGTSCCLQCLGTQCCDAIAACLGDAACKAAFEAYQDCEHGGQGTDISKCYSTFVRATQGDAAIKAGGEVAFCVVQNGCNICGAPGLF